MEYKVTLEDSGGSIIWTADPVYASDFSTEAKLRGYAGNPNGNVAGTAASTTIDADTIWDYTNNILYVCTTTGVAAAAVWTAVNASASTPAVPAPQGRLTLTSSTPVLAADVAAATAVYYTPYAGNLVPIYNGTSTVPTTFSELTLTLVASHALSTIYDVFVFSNTGVLTLATGPAWNTSTAGAGARGSGAGTTQLSRLNGFWANTVSMTGRNGSTTYTIAANRGTYLGSLFIDGTAGQVTCHVNFGQSRKWGVWNAYQRQPIILKAGDSTASWNYTTDTFRASNNSTANSATIFQGLPEEFYDIRFQDAVLNSTATAFFRVGIGFNSTSAASGLIGGGLTNTGQQVATSPAVFVTVPSIGINVVTCLERSQAIGTASWFGGEDDMLMTAAWRG